MKHVTEIKRAIDRDRGRRAKTVPELLRREAELKHAEFGESHPGLTLADMPKGSTTAKYAALLEAAADLNEHLRNHWYRGEACDEFERRVREVLG